MNIVLFGFRGAGKSTIGRILSKRLHRRLFSLDSLIIKDTGSSIPEIVNQHGWPRFREIEATLIQSIAKMHRNAIIDCGGGVVLNPENVRLLKLQGRIVWLTANIDEIVKRIHKDPNRPSLHEGVSFEEEQRKVLFERKPLYQAAADLICDTSKVPVDITASTIIRFFHSKSWI